MGEVRGLDQACRVSSSSSSVFRDQGTRSPAVRGVAKVFRVLGAEVRGWVGRGAVARLYKLFV